MYDCQLRQTVWKRRVEMDWDASVWPDTLLWQCSVYVCELSWTCWRVNPIRSGGACLFTIKSTILHFRSHPGLAPTFSLCFPDFSFSPTSQLCSQGPYFPHLVSPYICNFPKQTISQTCPLYTANGRVYVGFSPCFWVWTFGTAINTFVFRRGQTPRHTN